MTEEYVSGTADGAIRGVPSPQIIPMPLFNVERRVETQTFEAAPGGWGGVPSFDATAKFANSLQHVWEGMAPLQEEIASMLVALDDLHRLEGHRPRRVQKPEPLVSVDGIRNFFQVGLQAAKLLAGHAAVQHREELEARCPALAQYSLQQLVESSQEAQGLAHQVDGPTMPAGGASWWPANRAEDAYSRGTQSLAKMLGFLEECQKQTLSAVDSTIEGSLKPYAGGAWQEAAVAPPPEPKRDLYTGFVPARTAPKPQPQAAVAAVATQLPVKEVVGIPPRNPKAEYKIDVDKKNTLRAHLQLLQHKDPARVFIVRKIHHLGMHSPTLLKNYFERVGAVESVLVAPTCVRSKFRDAPARVRLSGVGFVVMESSEDAKQILAEGDWRTIHGVTISLSTFTPMPAQPKPGAAGGGDAGAAEACYQAEELLDWQQAQEPADGSDSAGASSS